MYRTEVGYTGGSTASPTYRSIGDHAEALQLHFDPTVIRFEDLLAMFWDGHDPSSSRSSQYRAGLYCQDDQQLGWANESAKQLAGVLGHPIATEIVANLPFYAAEDYHQKWRLRQQPALFDALRTNYESEAQLLASTASAKLNGYLGGHNTAKHLERNIERLGLSTDAQARLRTLTKR